MTNNAGGIAVTYQTIGTAETALRTAATSIVDRLNTLESQLSFLAADGYTGAGKDAYVQAKSTWDRAMREMIQLITDVEHKLPQISAAYRSTDIRAAARFGG